MTASKDRFPWEKHTVSPEAERLVSRNQAELNLERSMPKRWWHDMLFGWAGWAVIALIAVSVFALGWLLLSGLTQ